MVEERAEVFFGTLRAGLLTRTRDGFEFVYDRAYLSGPGARPISLSLPLRPEKYEAKRLFPFFEGLLPEGWLLALTCSLAGIDKRDKFGLLLRTGRDPIGAVSVRPPGEPHAG